MVYQVPSIFLENNYYQGLSLVLWIITISLMYMSALLLFFKSWASEREEAKKGTIAYAFFFILFGFTQIFYILGVYNPRDYDFFTTLGYIFAISALICVIYVLETQAVTSSHKIFLIITIIALIVSIGAFIGFTDRYFAVTLINILTIFSVLAICFLYLYLIVKSEGRVKKKAALLFLGIIFLYTGELLNSESFLTSYPHFPVEVIPIVMGLGVLIFTISDIFYKTN